MLIEENYWRIFAPNNMLASLRDLMNEVCRQICEYRESVPIVPELCLPTAAKEVSLTPLIMQAAYNLHRNDKAVFWPVSEMTATRYEKGSKGRIGIGIFSKRLSTFTLSTITYFHFLIDGLLKKVMKRQLSHLQAYNHEWCT